MDQPQPLEQLPIKIFGDGAARNDLLEFAKNDLLQGFTTNPSLMREAGVADYAAFAHELLAAIPDKPISFEVFSDDFAEMERQARLISQWGENVYVKIPVENTQGESSAPLIRTLAGDGIKLNITAVLTLEQVTAAAAALSPATPSIISVFAGRIADTGRDPLPHMREAKQALAKHPSVELLWASCREIFNIYQAASVGADIITVPYTILRKRNEIGVSLADYARAGVQTFYEAGKAAGYSL